MFAFKLIFVIIFIFFYGCECQRRVQNGAVVTNNKTYAVYFLKAAVSPRYYEGWVCGGALVSPEFIVTSAACVTDVTHLYAIAGYDKYVRDTEIDNDPCTKAKKKKVVLICTPKAYELKYEEIEKWSYIDIAVVKVESPYDFQDKSFEELCSYIPVPIIINYQTKYQESGVDGIVLGWGHQSKWRQQLDPRDYNQEKLHYAPILIQNKEDCKKEYAVYKGMDQVIDKYMICTFEKGNINDAGETIVKAPPRAQGCKFSPNGLRTFDGVSCENVNSLGDDMDLVENTRKNNALLNNRTANAKVDEKSNNVNDKIMNGSTVEKGSLNINNLGRMNTRRNGICQNDHGGPMVTWVGAHEVLIGVASVFKITEALECIGPYLFTSTQCNGAFLDCILRSDPEKTDTMRRAICDNATSAGFKLIEKKISWKHHPDGPAENELHDIHAPTITKKPFINQVNINNTKDKPYKLVEKDLTALQNNSPAEHTVQNNTVIYNATKLIKDSLDLNLQRITKMVEITTPTSKTTRPNNVTSLNTVSPTTNDNNATTATLENRNNITKTPNSMKVATTTVAQSLATK